MRIEIHILQNFAPSNLNRDDTGSPKDAEFGGYRRARISSQCIKRAVRRYFDTNRQALGFGEADLAIRTKRLLEEARRRLTKAGRDPAAIDRAVTAALAAAKIAMKSDDPSLTQYLLFLGEAEIARFVALVDKHFDVLSTETPSPDTADDKGKKKKTAKQQKAEAKGAAPEEVQKAVPALLDGGKAADLALFGRMLADLPERSVDAACQVAHAISTNKIHSMEMDYFTAVDDINNDNPGADMIGTVEFNSACFYRYANLDVAELVGGYRDIKKTQPFGLQGDAKLARTTANAFLRAFIHAVPTGKQNSFAAHNGPSLVFAVVRDGPPVSLANAFAKPVAVHPQKDEGLIEKSIAALDGYYGRLVGMYGDGGLKASAVCQMEGVELEHLKEDVGSVEKLIAAIMKAVFDGGKETP
jgi:CRISPR system Cascade subunit CasC